MLASAVGPAVPEEGQFPVPATSPCTFTVTFRAATGTVGLNPKTFTILDEYGHIHRPLVTAKDGGEPPGQVRPGQTVSLILTGVLPTGNGRLLWTPRGTTPVVAWDFSVEID